MNSRKYSNNLLVITIVTVCMIALYGQIDYTEESISFWDFSQYRRIANASPFIDFSIPQPFFFRMLGPYIVGLFPFPDPPVFMTLQYLLLLTFGILFYFYIHTMGVSPTVATITVILFIFNKYFFGFMAWDYFHINDLLSLLFLIILIRSMQKRNWVVFGATMLIGVLTREVAVLMVPAVFVDLLEKKQLSREGRIAFTAIVPAAIIFLLLRLLAPVQGETLLQAFLAHSNKLYVPEMWFRLLINVFIPVSLLPLIFYEDTLLYFRKYKFALVLFVFTFLSTLFGINNERLMAPAAIVFYPLIAIIMDKHFKDNRLILGGILLCAFAASFHHVITRFDFINLAISLFISLTSLMIVSCIAFTYRLFQRNAGSFTNLFNPKRMQKTAFSTEFTEMLKREKAKDFSYGKAESDEKATE